VFPSSGSGVQQLAIFSSEYNAISLGVLGMKVNEQKKIPLSSGIPMTQEWSVEQLLSSKINLSDLSPGDNFFIGISDDPDAVANKSTVNTYVRIGEITNKSADGVVVDFSYPVMDVRVVSINKR
jgi:hypothetical protein